jgi:hypothetical protein
MAHEPSPHETKSRSINLEVVRDEPARRDPWRPTTLTIRKFLKICHAVEQGASITASCESQLISYSRFRFRVSRSERLQERLKEAEATRESFLMEFHINNIKQHAPRNVLASLWWLERRHPNLYALRRVDRSSSEDKPTEPDIPAAVLLEHRALQLQLAREDEAKAAGKVAELPVAG